MLPIGFEFGFHKKLHVVKTRPEDWEETGIDLSAFVTSVNEIKAKHSVFQEESPTEIDHDGNPNVLLMWKASIQNKQEALLIINKDIYNKQTFTRRICITMFRPEPPWLTFHLNIGWTTSPHPSITICDRGKALS